jgi:glyoxylase-like metal-dependent hydrolase (beta-lactamase superfamily II)
VARTLTSILGNSQRLDGGAMFGNAPKPVWQAWAPPDERNRIALATRALLVRDGGRSVLCEAGIGAFFTPKLQDRYGVVEPGHVLLGSLQARGVAPGDIDVVVLSHLHFDHAGGILTAYEAGREPALVFSRARFVVGRTAWERAKRPHVRDRASYIPEIVALLEASGRLEIVAGDTSETLGAGYRFHVSHGHTPGMLLTEVAMPAGPVVFAGDLIPGTPWVHLPITMGYDRYPELLIDEKLALLEGLVARNGRLFYTHDPHTAISFVGRDGAGRFSARAPAAEVVDGAD